MVPLSKPNRLHDRINSIRRGCSLTPSHFIEMPVPRQESKRLCICVFGISILSLFLRFFNWISKLFRQCGILCEYILPDQFAWLVRQQEHSCWSICHSSFTISQPILQLWTSIYKIDVGIAQYWKKLYFCIYWNLSNNKSAVWFINFHHTIIYKVQFYWTEFVMSNFKYKHSLNLLFIEYMFDKVVIWCVDILVFWVHTTLCCFLCLYSWTVLYTETRIVEDLRSVPNLLLSFM